jgi:hypothetical protein
MPDSPSNRLPEARDRIPPADYHVLWLIKRPAYRCGLAVPTARPLWQSDDGAVVQLCFGRRSLPDGAWLSLQELEDLCDSLRQLVAYVQCERACRRRAPTPGGADVG